MPPRHPTVRLICWLCIVLAIQEMSPWALPLVAVVFFAAAPTAFPRWKRLAYRTRWLLLSLLVILSVSVAGTPLWEEYSAGPTWEGLVVALVQCGRLLLVLAAVAALLETTSLPFLMAGCHGLLRPFENLGVSSDRAVARLSLTLHYAETLPRPRDWRALLQPFDGHPAGGESRDDSHRVFLPRMALVPMDLLALAVTVFVLVAAIVSVRIV